MATTELTPTGDDRSLGDVFFAAPADDPRARRPVDFAVLAVSVVVAVLAGWAYEAGTDIDQRLLDFFSDGVPGWLSAVATTVYVVGALYPIGLIVAILVFGNGRHAIARDMVLSALLALAMAALGSFLAGREWPDVIPEILERDGTPSFPLVRLTVAVAVLRVATPYLSVPMRQVGRRLMVPMAVAAIVLSYASFSSVIGAYAAGTASAAAVHLLFGSAVGIPSRNRIAGAFRTLEIDPSSIRYLDDQPIGATLAQARTADGDDVLVKVYGRDAADAAMANRAWRATWYRDEHGSLATTGLQQVEHEGLMLFEAARAGAPAPTLKGWGRGRSGDAAIATTWYDAPRLCELSDDAVADDALDRCWRALARLHNGGIAHRAIDGHKLVVVDDEVIIEDLSDATVSPDSSTRAADIAQMLVATALVAGSERAIAAARRQLGDDVLASGLQQLQRSALSSTLQRDVRQAKLDLKKLRSEVAGVIDIDVPELVELRRVTWGNVAMVALTFFAASALIGSLADIGLSTVSDEFSNAAWGWLITAFILAQLTNVGEWYSLTGMVAKPVPFGPTLMFRYAISFISLAVPSEAGAIAMNVRYMQRLGVPAPAALAQGPLLTIISKTFDVILLLITARIVGQNVDLDDIDSGPVLRLIILVVVLVVIGAIITFSVPALRNRVLPPIRSGLSAVRGALTDPQRLTRILIGTLAQRLLFPLALTASVFAFGGSIGFSEAIFVNSAVGLFVGLVPVPGGIGVAEAALTTGLTAMGVPQGAALAAAISHRFVTAYLPPIYGWYTTRWLTERDYL